MKAQNIKTNGKYCSYACPGRHSGPVLDLCRYFGGVIEYEPGVGPLRRKGCLDAFDFARPLSGVGAG
jgi:hypothetical protein